MSKRANPMAVKAALTYEISEAAKALGKSEATIRNWIKDGLPAMTSQKPYLISGADLRTYIKAKRAAEKSPLLPDQLYCPSCRVGRKPVKMTVFAVPNTPQTTRLMGICDRCGGQASRMISKIKPHPFAQTFKIKEGEGSEAYQIPTPPPQIGINTGVSNDA